jgi:hypothetical protein
MMFLNMMNAPKFVENELKNRTKNPKQGHGMLCFEIPSYNCIKV